MKKLNLYRSVLSTVLISGIAFAEPEVTGKLTIESASYTDNEYVQESYAYDNDNAQIGNNSQHGTGTLKNEVNARIYVDGDLEDTRGSTYHVELQAYNDSDAVSNYQGNESYTQRDALREAYVDTSYDDWLIRAGKQQVVWGTADGMKLLDSINPTDFSEMAQNQMEDSRIPVWMLNAEKATEDGGNFQFIISQPRENIFAGLNRNISTATRDNNAVTSLTASPDKLATGLDTGHPFILKGVDSITGKSNGFVNIVPDLGSVAYMFGMAFDTDPTTNGPMGLDPTNHAAMNYFTVGSFNNSSTNLKQFSGSYNLLVSDNAANAGDCTALGYGGTSCSSVYGFSDLVFGTTNFWTKVGSSTVAKTASTAGTGYTGQQALGGFAGLLPASNLLHTDSAVDSVFEYMDRTPFSTFDAFVGAKSRYDFNMPSDSDVDYSMRYKNTTPDGMNYSLNYSYAYDKNPIINMHWENSSGTKLYSCRNDIDDSSTKYLTLETQSDCSGANATSSAASDYNVATLVFTQEVKRIHNIGGSFDMALETEALGPVVIRGEALYQKDTYSPVMDRGALSIGDLTKALTMRKGDRLKYVIGADITAMTNMMISAQFIQDRNLDYIDNKVDFDGSTACSVENCGVYTTDYATMHLTNGFNKAAENKNFYSLYLSKPYGESGQHRWNNITIFEETGGYWNRLDTEYTLDDNTVLTGEINSYWGDANTQFGQLETSSNVQVGLKYTF